MSYGTGFFIFTLAFRSFHLLIGAADYTAMTTEKLTFFYNRSMGEKNGFKLANALANVYWMYLEFPKHFFIVLDDFLRRNKGQQRYERLSSFETIFDDQDFTWVQEAYTKRMQQTALNTVSQAEISDFALKPANRSS